MTRLHRDVMRTLTSEIVSGVRPSGAMLPREVDLAAEFDVSRGVARETVRAMEERGLIAVKHGKGATVNSSDKWDVLAATLETERGGEVLAEYLECRRILEVEAAGIAAQRARKRDKVAMREAFSRMEVAAGRPASHAAEELFHQADVVFHHALIAATGNQALIRLVERLHSALLVARFPLARPAYREQRALPEHRRILEAVEQGSVREARAAVSDHLDTIAGYLAEHRRASRRGRTR
jgi:DNA-binding FadR family transcriptional regulator